MLSSARGLGLPRGLVVRRFVVLFIAVLAFVLAPWPATAAPPDNFPDQIDLPNGFFPEGIESGRGTSFFVGSLIDGAILRGDLRTGSSAVLAPGATGRASLGIAYEAARNRLWVAGGGPGFNAGVGDVRVYDASSGELLATFLPPGPVGALNDVAITHDAVYVTDSFNAQLVKIPLPADGSLPPTNSATLLPVTGDFVQTPGVANLNGIVAKSGVLIVAQSSTGKLFRVDPCHRDGRGSRSWRRGPGQCRRPGAARAHALRGAQHQPGDGRTARFSVSHRDRARRYHRSRPRRPHDGDRGRRAPVGCQRPVRYGADA